MRLCGYAVVRLYGYAVVRLYGCAVVRSCGCAVVRLCGCTVMRLYSCTVMRLCGSTANICYSGYPLSPNIQTTKPLTTIVRSCGCTVFIIVSANAMIKVGFCTIKVMADLMVICQLTKTWNAKLSKYLRPSMPLFPKRKIKHTLRKQHDRIQVAWLRSNKRICVLRVLNISHRFRGYPQIL